MASSKHLSNNSKTTPTIAPRTRKTFTQDYECKPSTSQINDEIYLVETIKNVIKEVGELTKSLEFNQDQLNEEIGNAKKKKK